MGLLPDLDEKGKIIAPPRKHFMSRTTHRKKTFLSWENLLLNRCPDCGEFFPQKDGDRICMNHSGNPFKIPESRFREICRNIETKDDGGWIRNIE